MLSASKLVFSRFSRAAMLCLALWQPAVLQAASALGMSTFMAGELPVTLSYPTSSGASRHAVGPFVIEVAMDAPPAAGRYPLVVLSHGTGGSPLADHELVRALVSGGFVVAQPLHSGDNFEDGSRSGAESWRLRPGEVVRLLDALGQSDTWSAQLQLERVGVHGFSAGGVTALSLAGGQWRMLELIRHCNSHPEDDAFCFSGAREPEQREMRQGRYRRAASAPEQFLPDELKEWRGGRPVLPEDQDPRPDPRIAAVTLAVPAAAMFSAESLARIRLPVGVVRASGDRLLLPQYHADRVLQHCSSCRLLADVDGQHSDLLGPLPAVAAEQIARRFPQGGLPDPQFDAARRAQAFAQIVAFYQAQLQP